MNNKRFKLDEIEPEDFAFNRQPKNVWLRRPIYFLLILLVIVIFFGSYIYYQNINTGANNVITENLSPKKNFEPQVSGAEMMGEIDKYQDYLNILLLGIGGANHPGGGLTDVIQVLTINTRTNKGLIFSVPRDLYVKVDGYGYHKINTVYNYGQQSGHGGGGILAKKEIEQVLGIPLHYYIKIDFDGFTELVDVLDGVDICVDSSINDPQNQIYVESGCQEMDGEKALAYARSRYTTSDFDRSQRQQKLIFGIKEKVLKLNFLLNPIKINQTLSVLTGNLNTDIKIGELNEIGNVLSDLDKNDLDSYVLDNRKDNLLYSTSKYGAYVLLPIGDDFKKIRKFVGKKIELLDQS